MTCFILLSADPAVETWGQVEQALKLWFITKYVPLFNLKIPEWLFHVFFILLSVFLRDCAW